MNKRIISLCLASLIALTASNCPQGGDVERLIGGLASPGTPADFTITAVTIGPVPSQPGAGTVTVTVDYVVNQPGGVVSVVIWLFDDDQFLRFEDDELVAVVQGGGATAIGPDSMATSFALQCGGPDGDEVVAGANGTGEGHNVFLVGTDEAEITAAARREIDSSGPVVASAVAEMWCE